MKVQIFYNVLEANGTTLFGGQIDSGVKETGVEALASIQAVLQSRKDAAVANVAKHEEALTDFTG